MKTTRCNGLCGHFERRAGSTLGWCTNPAARPLSWRQTFGDGMVAVVEVQWGELCRAELATQLVLPLS